MTPVSDATVTALAMLQEGTGALDAAGLADARRSAEWLLAAVLGVGRFGVYLDPARELSAGAVDRYRRLIERRAGREPLQHLIGFEDFHGLRLAVSGDVLIPRPETEGLVEWAVAELRERPGARVADVGTGSGAIACALASRVPGLEVTAVDCSVAALAVAARNVEAHGLADRVRLVAGDLLDPLRVLGATVDMIVANLPYLPSAVIPTLPAEVSRSEPRLALDGGADGMVLVRRAILEAPAVLAPGGRLLMEIGEGQSWPLASLMAAQGFAEVVSRRDLNGVERYLGGRWATASASAAALDQRTR